MFYHFCTYTGSVGLHVTLVILDLSTVCFFIVINRSWSESLFFFFFCSIRRQAYSGVAVFIAWPVVFQVMCKAHSIYCADRSAEWTKMRMSLCGTLEARQSLLFGTPELWQEHRWTAARFHNSPPAGISAVHPHFGWHAVQIPGEYQAASLLHLFLEGSK